MSITIKAQSQVDGLNVSNTNAASIFKALGIEFDYCGSVDPETVLKNIQNLNNILRPPMVDDNFIDCGVSAGQVHKYIKALRAIAKVAIDTKCLIQWS